MNNNLYSKISTDPGQFRIRHSHRFVAVVIQILFPFVVTIFLFKPFCSIYLVKEHYFYNMILNSRRNVDSEKIRVPDGI